MIATISRPKISNWKTSNIPNLGILDASQLEILGLEIVAVI